MNRWAAAGLTDGIAAVFAAAGCAPGEARIIAEHLVGANLAGHDSHGVIRLREYIPWLGRGLVRANRTARIVFETETAAVIDGDLGFGQVIAQSAVETGIAKAKAHGLAITGIRNTGHLGRIGHWAEQAAAAGLLSLHFVNTSGFGMLVAPFGSREARLSANPLAAGVPRPGQPPLILDISTAAIAEGKIKVAANTGKPLPEGAVVDHAGRPTTDARAFYGPPRGAILPFGGHKGYGLSVILEVLAGALTGGGTTNPANPSARALVNNMCSIFIAPDALGAGSALATETTALEAWIRSAAPAGPGGEILLPGEAESRNRQDRLAHGVPLDEATWGDLVATARTVGVDLASLAPPTKRSHDGDVV